MVGIEQKTARPTEYKGVRYDSKSEAVFARFLDCIYASWQSRTPDGTPLLAGGHPWDFALWINDNLWMIEYKPSAPTDTYLAELSNSADAGIAEFNLGKSNGKWKKTKSCSFAMVYGSPWKPIAAPLDSYIVTAIRPIVTPMTSLFSRWHPKKHQFQNFYSLSIDAKLFRFDLK